MSGGSLDCGISEVCTSCWHSSSISSSRTTTTDEFVKFATKLFPGDQVHEEVVGKDETIRRIGDCEEFMQDGPGHWTEGSERNLRQREVEDGRPSAAEQNVYERSDDGRHGGVGRG